MKIAKEAIWIKKFIIEFGVVSSIINSIPLYSDNNEAIVQAKGFKCKLKCYHLIIEIVDMNDVKIEKIFTDDIAFYSLRLCLRKSISKPLILEKRYKHANSFGLSAIKIEKVSTNVHIIHPLSKALSLPKKYDSQVNFFGLKYMDD